MTHPPPRDEKVAAGNSNTIDGHAAVLLMMTPPASPSTMERRQQRATCLDPPTLKRKRDEEFSLPPPIPDSFQNDHDYDEFGIDIRYHDRQSRNKRRATSSARNRSLLLRSQGPLPMLNVTDFTGGPTIPVDYIRPLHDAETVPYLSLRPRTDSFEEPQETSQQQPPQDDKDNETSSDAVHVLPLEQDENIPPASKGDGSSSQSLSQQERAAKATAIVPKALDVASSASTGMDAFAFDMSSPVSSRYPRQRTSSIGSLLGVSAAALMSTPLSSATYAVASAPCKTKDSRSSTNTFLTLSLSKRRLSFGATGHVHNRRNSRTDGFSYETPKYSASTLVQSLEGLSLPSLEDIDFFTDDGAMLSQHTRTLQQKRPPSTPHQGNNHNNVNNNGNNTPSTNNRGRPAATTFDYLATALRLPDIAFSNGNM